MPEIVQPEPLVKGDRICILPTARAITYEELKPGIELARSWGFDVVIAENVGAKDNQFAGTDEERARAFAEAWLDPSVKAIWCARGGYGTVRILPFLQHLNLREAPKWVMGFSDVTALHNYFHLHGVATLHAQMPFAIDKKTSDTHLSIQQALDGKFRDISAPEHESNQQGEAIGELVGGNLSVLYSLRGSEFDLNVEGKILFLEDLDELLYHVDRMAMNLHASSWHQKLAGVVVGGMTDMWDKNEHDPFGHNAEQIIKRALGGEGIPIGFGLPVGHARDNRALLFGKKAKLSVDTEGTKLSFQ